MQVSHIVPVKKYIDKKRGQWNTNLFWSWEPIVYLIETGEQWWQISALHSCQLWICSNVTCWQEDMVIVMVSEKIMQ
jgi:hypothetical protein